MSLWKIAWRSIQQRGLASLLTGISMALGVALVVVVLVVYGVLNAHFMQGAQGYHLVIGAKGSKQQLVFNTVYHLDQPIENIPYSYYKEFTEGKFASATKLAIPICLGDSYHAADQTFRVVGTTPALFDQIEYGRRSDGTAKRYVFEPGGRNFRTENFFEAVIGSVVAHEAGLKIGDTFRPAHGIVEEGEDAHEHDAFTVVGILQSTGTPNDRALFVNIEGFYLLEDHAKGPAKGTQTDDIEEKIEHEHEHEIRPLPEEQREVTAILVLLNSDLFSQSVYTMVNEGSVAQAVYPSREIVKFFATFLAPVRVVLLAMTVLIVVVASVGILVSIYNSMSERRREIAVMRALGAGRATVMAVILLESILLSLVGGLAGLALGHAAMALVSPYVVERAGVAIGFLQYHRNELILIPGLVVLATLAGLLPAVAAYRTDVARSLSASP